MGDAMRIVIYWHDMIDIETNLPLERTWSSREENEPILNFVGTRQECEEEAKKTISGVIQKPIRYVPGHGILPVILVDYQFRKIDFA